MRKKKHFQVNPRNREYDRFYLVNYIQEKEDLSSQMEATTLDPDEDGEFEDWQEELDEGKTMCLFDELLFATNLECHEHMVSVHHFDIKLIATDVYDRIKMINHIRRQVRTFLTIA